MDDNPLVVAVMATGKDPETRTPFARTALQAFAAQTYKNAVLLIVNHGSVPVVESYGDWPIVHEEFVQVDSLGELRNKALDLVYETWPGAYVIQWDDDDWSAPDRIERQVQVAKANPDCAVTLASQIRYSFDLDSAFVSRDPQGFGIFGTVLHPPTRLRYELVGKHEDSRFLKTLPGVVLCEAPATTYIRFEHGKNTWDRRHIMRGRSRRHLWQLKPDEKKYLRRTLEERYAWKRTT